MAKPAKQKKNRSARQPTSIHVFALCARALCLPLLFLLLSLSPSLSLPRILFLSPAVVEFLSVALVRGLLPPALFTPPPPALL
jgi:hypothetical protein